MASYTPNYGLHQWEPEDSFLRTDFNEDLSTLDYVLADKAGQAEVSALGLTIAQKALAAPGTFIGNGGQQQITLGFPPIAVLLPRNYYTLCATPGETVAGLSLTEDGFSVLYTSSAAVPINSLGAVYHYLVLYR